MEILSILLLGLPGGPELIIIVVVILLLFGGRKIPELMKGLGKGIREFNNAKNDVKKHIEDGMTDEPEKAEDDTKKEE
jgi:sec-independent protein translocase protein TatA